MVTSGLYSAWNAFTHRFIHIAFHIPGGVKAYTDRPEGVTGCAIGAGSWVRGDAWLFTNAAVADGSLMGQAVARPHGARMAPAGYLLWPPRAAADAGRRRRPAVWTRHHRRLTAAAPLSAKTARGLASRMGFRRFAIFRTSADERRFLQEAAKIVQHGTHAQLSPPSQGQIS